MGWAHIVLSFLLTGYVHSACHGKHNCVIEPTGSSEVDEAIVNIALHYSDDLCLEILLIDCTKHTTVGDEIVCSSNGDTYENHCHFAHARCEFLFNDKHNTEELSVVHSGACLSTTVRTPAPSIADGFTTAQATSVPATATALPASQPTAAPAVSATNSLSTVSPATSPATTAATTAIPPTTQPVTTMMTTISIHNIVQNVFCQNVNTINCSNAFNIVCGSDGRFYPNDCELSKEKCKNPSLTTADISICTLSTPASP